ncbi:hypothetical protein ACFQH6_07405 [Halobacteriaceae archaeon GCM10025711]
MTRWILGLAGVVGLALLASPLYLVTVQSPVGGVGPLVWLFRGALALYGVVLLAAVGVGRSRDRSDGAVMSLAALGLALALASPVTAFGVGALDWSYLVVGAIALYALPVLVRVVRLPASS